jgi:hypothetical protein
MTTPIRLRQVVLVTRDLASVAGRLQSELGLPEPYIDPGVGEFGLENRVFAAGDCFVEVLTPIKEGTAGGRYLDRRGGDAGYMAIFQLADLETARKRIADLGIRIVWQGDLGDISGTHLHPQDVPGAIVSLDWADPPESWHWAGPDWQGGAPADRAGGVTELTVAAVDPHAMADRWAEVLGLDALLGGDIAVIRLDDAGQELRFVHATDPASEGIVEVGLHLPAPTTEKSTEIGGVRFTVGPA